MEHLHNTGCVIAPRDARDFDYGLIAGASVELPDEFVIDVPWHFYQNGIDSCVGAAVATAKSVQEGKKLSMRVAWGLAKFYDNYQGWGTYINHALKGMIEIGATEHGYIDEDIGMDREKYMRFPIDDSLKKVAEPNKASSYWWVRGWEWGSKDFTPVLQAIYKEKIPVVTSAYWYTSYNQLVNGFLPAPSGDRLGHAFIIKGWRIINGQRAIVFQNSWSETWGDKGDFYIYEKDLLRHEIGACYIITDIPKDKGWIINKYQGKVIRNTDRPEHYFINGKQIAWIKDESVFKFGRESGWWGNWGDVVTIKEKIEHDVIV